MRNDFRYKMLRLGGQPSPAFHSMQVFIIIVLVQEGGTDLGQEARG